MHFNRPPDKINRKKRKIVNRCEGARGRWSCLSPLLIKLAHCSAARILGLLPVAVLIASSVRLDEGGPGPHIDSPVPKTKGKRDFCLAGSLSEPEMLHSSAEACWRVPFLTAASPWKCGTHLLMSCLFPDGHLHSQRQPLRNVTDRFLSICFVQIVVYLRVLLAFCFVLFYATKDFMQCVV